MGLAFGASAQRAQLQLGYGGYTQMDATNMHSYGAVNHAWGALTAGVNFKVAPKISLGATYTFSSTDYKNEKKGNVYYHVAMANVRYDYYKNSIVNLYAHGGLGVCFTHMANDGWQKNKAYCAYQIAPLGAEVGLTRSAAIFGELGFGAQGLLQVGFRYNL